MVEIMLREIGTIVLAVCLGFGSAEAQEPCSRPDVLGTARVLPVSAATAPRVGLKSFPATLPLGPKEVVLTFDDGPWRGTTDRVLDALRAECVRATFFLLGRNAAAHPALARRIQREGHSIGHHSHTHPRLDLMPLPRAMTDIARGMSAVGAALHGTSEPDRAAPFFRFPGFASSPSLLAALEQRGIVVFGTDLWASDWTPMSAGTQLARLTSRLDAAGRGIILLHDTKAQTAAMLPGFLRALARGGFRVVHVVPAPGLAAAVN